MQNIVSKICKKIQEIFIPYILRDLTFLETPTLAFTGKVE